MSFGYSYTFSWEKISHKVTFIRLLLNRTDFELKPLLKLVIHPKYMRPFLIGLKANWCLPYLEDGIHFIGNEGDRPSINLVFNAQLTSCYS